MTWKHSVGNRKAVVESVEDSITKRGSIPQIDGMIIRDLREHLSDREIAEILLHIRDLANFQDKDAEWFHKALDHKEKLEDRKGKPYSHKMTKVEKWAGRIARDYENPPEYADPEKNGVDEDYWQGTWRQAKRECSDSTLRRIRERLKDEHGLELEPVHGNVSKPMAKPTIEVVE